MKTLHHDLLVKFLAQNESSFREVFFRNMTERSISIIQEDIELNSDFSESEKADSTNEMLMTIRKILNYN
jgi:flagellar motor switch protein FliG